MGHEHTSVWICIETLYTEYTPLSAPYNRGKRAVGLKIKDSLQWREWVQKNPDPRDVSKLCSATQTIAFICYPNSTSLNNKYYFCREQALRRFLWAAQIVTRLQFRCTENQFTVQVYRKPDYSTSVQETNLGLARWLAMKASRPYLPRLGNLSDCGN